MEDVEDKKGDAEAALVRGSVYDGTVECRIGDSGAGARDRAVIGRYGGCGGGGPGSAAGGDCREVGGGAYGCFGDVPGARSSRVRAKGGLLRSKRY
jgi:hypothetical protein